MRPRLESIEEIERLWYELQREITEQGKVVKFTTEYATADGERITDDIVRVGVFNIVFEDGYLQYDEQTGNVTELQRQPEQGKYTGSTEDMVDETEGYVPFGLDVTRGGILSLLVESPTIGERIEQGGIVGYVIITLGLLGVLLSLERLYSLTMAGRRVSAQLKQSTPTDDNALGRVLMVYDSNKNVSSILNSYFPDHNINLDGLDSLKVLYPDNQELQNAILIKSNFIKYDFINEFELLNLFF